MVILLLLTGTSTHDRLSMVLMDTRRLNDIKKLSSDGQTSCLEGLHSTLNHWHAKMQHFSLARYILQVNMYTTSYLVRVSQTIWNREKNFDVSNRNPSTSGGELTHF